MTTRRLRFSTLLLVLMLFPAGGSATAQTFTLVTDGAVVEPEGWFRGVTWVDVDNDGDLDLFAPNAVPLPGTLESMLLRNDGDGTYTRITDDPIANATTLSSGSCWADVDNDGDVDAYVPGSTSPFVPTPDPGSFLYRNDGLGGFTPERTGPLGDAVANRGWSCAWGDYDANGYVDLFVAHPQGFVPPNDDPLSNRLFRNDGGHFTPVTDTPITDGLAPYTVGQWTDFDQDDDLDLFIGSGPVTGTPGPDFLYRNLRSETGSATFERITEAPLAEPRDGQVWNFVDVDNDGDFDAYVTNYTQFQNNFYRNDDGTFVEVTDSPLTQDAASSLANVWGDFDNDGDLDVFVANELGFGNRFYRNDGPPHYTFTETGDFTGDTISTWGASAGDADLDGDLDLYVATTQSTAFGGGPNFFYRNDTADAGHWIVVRLDGRTSNRSGVGAKVRATATLHGRRTTQLREVSTQNSFNGHNALDVHVGLADARAVETLRVEWPSGVVDVATDVAPNRYYVAVEGVGLVPQSVALADELDARVSTLAEQGVLNRGQSRSLEAKLDAARKAIDRGQPHVGRKLLRVYQAQIEAFAHTGFLNAEQKRILTDPARTAETLLAGWTARPASKTTASATPDAAPAFGLTPSAPNPFTSQTTLGYTLPSTMRVTLTVYDVLGRRVTTLVDDLRPAGPHTLTWDGTDAAGRRLAGGVYVSRLTAGDRSATQKLVLVR